MSYDIPIVNVGLKSSLPKNVITADRIPVTTHAANLAQIFCIEEQKYMQLKAILQQKLLDDTRSTQKSTSTSNVHQYSKYTLIHQQYTIILFHINLLEPPRQHRRHSNDVHII